MSGDGLSSDYSTARHSFASNHYTANAYFGALNIAFLFTPLGRRGYGIGALTGLIPTVALGSESGVERVRCERAF